jgi:hypothetical protein
MRLETRRRINDTISETAMDAKRRRITATTKKGPVAPPMTALEEKQELLRHHVRMLAKGMSFGLFVAGSGGLGKSKVISETLADEGVVPILANSHVTPLALYGLLFHNRQGKVIWLDDADSLYTNMAILGLLRSALWGTGEARTVTYLSSQLEGLPSSFEFDSSIIFTANTIPKRNEAFKAVLSRVDVFELTATNEEVLEVMRVMATKGHGVLSPSLCRDVVEFIAKAGGSRQLSLRLFDSAMKKVEYAVNGGAADWRELVRSQLDQLGQPEGVLRPLDSKAHDAKCLAIAVERHPASVKLQEEVWREMTGKSRASFFRTKREYEGQVQAAHS